MRHTIRLREQHPALRQRVDVGSAVALIHDLRIAAILLDHYHHMLGARQLLGMGSGRES